MMAPEIGIRGVNWTSGMRVGAAHLIQLETFAEDRVRDALTVLMGKHAFGLLAPLGGVFAESVPGGSRTGSSGVCVRVESCNILTQNGERIQFPVGDGDTRTLSATCTFNPAEENYVVLCRQAGRIAVGESSGDSPQRKLDCLPELELRILPRDAVLGDARCLPVARFKRNETSLDDSYIPPCAVIEASPLLLESAGGIVKQLDELLHNYIRSIGNRAGGQITQRQQTTSPPTTLPHDGATMVATVVSDVIDSLHHTYREMSPFQLFLPVVRLARYLDLMPPSTQQRADAQALWTDATYLRTLLPFPDHDVAPLFHRMHSFLQALNHFLTPRTERAGGAAPGGRP